MGNHAKTLGLIHTSATLVPIFADLCAQHLPHVETFNIVDDSLIKDVIRRNELTEQTASRVGEYVKLAAQAGADHILVTCSSIGRAVEAAQANVTIPVLRVDQPMADNAIRQASHIGVVATLPTTLEPTADLVRRRAAVLNREVELTVRLCEGAFDALMSGDSQTHDSMVADALAKLINEVDVVLLAQASMARVVEHLGRQDRDVLILASPPAAIEYLKSVLV
ncbi:MAG: aspartate/glutamate racemase family protein [Planctomycetales bacterium]|nr:aspartate/glutamate racemase family protein [Planctomycetales bacterium]